MRTTQFIGLNKVGLDYTHSLERVTTDNHTLGMFEEKVPLGEWIDVDGVHVKEVVQMAPWSSGPMIFTCLVRQNTRLAEWVECKNVYGQFDRGSGRMYV